MQGTAVKYQLRRMVLVNAGTNMHMPSGRITAIDPRGGAAVLGDNGVGKTTTLRVLPLFFGHLPSQIVSAGHGQEPLIRFVLPTTASAVAFEYQRGSDQAEDLRMAVIRRSHDDPDTPFYRLYRGGFLKELFVDEGRFLSDDETQKRAVAMGIQTSRKLTTAEYRAVILKTSVASKDKERLRRDSLEWSFGPKPLDNLDRLVAAMVKKHINFSDIVQVAVSLVQQDLGHGSEHAKLTYKQGKGPIEHWLKNRAACADAFKLAPRLTQLDGHLKDHRLAETQLRARRADVEAVEAARLAEQEKLTKTTGEMARARADIVAAQLLERETLEGDAAKAASAALLAKSAYDEQFETAQYFETHRATYWEPLVQDLAGLQAEKQVLDRQVGVAESAHAEAVAQYAQLEQEARTAQAQHALALEQQKQPHRARCASTLEQIALAEAAAKQEAGLLESERQRKLALAREPLLEQRGTWETRKGLPMASDAALQEAAQANELLHQHSEEQGQAQLVHSQATAAALAARQAFTAHEQDIRTARAEQDAAGLAAEAARQAITPGPGTLRAVLREHGDDAWKRTLAKVINPALLEREDLDPSAIEDAVQTLYGWQLNTGAIASPDWADDERARQACELADARYSAAQAHLLSRTAALGDKSAALKIAESAADVAQARLGVLTRQAGELKNSLATAKNRVDTEKLAATSKAIAELARLKGELADITAQQHAAKLEFNDQLLAIKAAHDEQRTSATKLRDDAIATITQSILRSDTELETKVQGIRAQLAEHLTANGVDTKRLEALKEQADVLDLSVRERQEKAPMVERWRAWVAEGGTVNVAKLKSAALQAQTLTQQKAAALTEFDANVEKETKRYAALIATENARLAVIETELLVLAGLIPEFGYYQAMGKSVIDVRTTAAELRGTVQADKATLTAATESVTTLFSSLRQALTGKDTAVRELVEGSLQRVADGSAILRAEELCRCYKLIGPQIANDVNLTLKTLLANIEAFRNALRSFEKEVASFNSRLQAGLTEVRCFERIKDLRLDVITNFDTLGFYKKLSRMADVAPQHSREFGKNYSIDLPSDETARALGDFVSVLSSDGSVEVNLSSHITLKGSVTDNGQHKEFKRASELENISSDGLTSLVLITLMTALLNTIRGAEPVHVPWVTDEVGKFDSKNFLALIHMLQNNRIDVVTASPELGPAQQAMFSHRYLFEDRGRIREYSPAASATIAPAPAADSLEVSA